MNLDLVIYRIGATAIAVAIVMGISSALRGAGGNHTVQKTVPWTVWGLGVAALLFGAELNWFRAASESRTAGPMPAAVMVAIGVMVATFAVALMARDGFKAGEFASTLLAIAIVAIAGWLVHEVSRTLTALAATIGIQLVRFGSSNAQAKLAAKEGRLGKVSAPAGWILTLAGTVVIAAAVIVANGGNIGKWLPEWQGQPDTAADGRAARGTAGPKTTPTPVPPTAAKTAVCYRPNADRSMVTIVEQNQPARVKRLAWDAKVRAYLNLTLPFIFEQGGPVVDVPRCPITASDPP